MKKVVTLAIVGVMGLSLFGCSTKNTTGTDTTTTSNTAKEEKIENTKTLDGLTLSVTAKFDAIKGDRTKDNVADKNGEYFANGSEIVKASDYKKIVVFVDVKNDTDKAISVAASNWSGELQDEYKLKAISGSNKGNDQVQAKASGKYELNFVVKNDITAEKIKLDYLWIKNKDEYSKIFKDPDLMKMSKAELAEKYKDVLADIQLQTDVQK